MEGDFFLFLKLNSIIFIIIFFYFSFQLLGKVACIRIKVGRGVCGTTVKSGTTTVVPDVHKFPGHIACDSASNSEIVIPIFANDKQGNRRCVGVLDIDSPRLNAMDQEDKLGLEPIVEELSKACDWSEIFAQQDKS